jgi:hypothetical protein
MSAAKPVAISVRPFQTAQLCFEGGGLLELLNVELGAQVKAFDFATFYGTLRAGPTVSGDTSRLRYNFADIDAAVAAYALASLRKEARKTALNSAINARQNAFFAKYANAPAIVAMMNQFYSSSVAGSKPQRLDELMGLSTTQWNQLQKAYSSAGRTGVVTTTNSVLCSDTVSYGYSAAGGIAEQIAFSAGDFPENAAIPTPTNPPGPWPAPQWPSPCVTSQRDGNANEFLPYPEPPGAPLDTWGLKFTGSGSASATVQKSSSYQTTSNGDRARQSQSIVNTDYGYRFPYNEAAAQYQRAQISLMDQQFAQFMYGQNLPNLAQVFQNELNSIDGNVFRLQIAYLNSILLSPIAGVVTGVYRNPGEAVRAGDTIIRVEDSSTIYLIATVIYRGPIVVGALPPAPPIPNSTVTINTKLFGVSSLASPLSGTVVAARGHRDEDKWDLIVKCSNLDGSGNSIFPTGYHFDYDDTQISIS